MGTDEQQLKDLRYEVGCADAKFSRGDVVFLLGYIDNFKEELRQKGTIKEAHLEAQLQELVDVAKKVVRKYNDGDIKAELWLEIINLKSKLDALRKAGG